MRVIAGTARGRKLVAPEGRTTRPITDRAKEGIFNMIEARGGLAEARVADLFAGSGSFGIEALSRGAAHATFVERDRKALTALEKNLATVGFDDRATVVAGTVEAAIEGLGPLDVVFCDPPYPDDPWLRLLDRLEADLLVGHAEADVELTDRWTALKRRRYGRSHIVLAAPASNQPPPQGRR